MFHFPITVERVTESINESGKNTMPHPSEKGHFYHPDGKPCYEVPYADPSKGMRPTTLGDAKKLGLLPSVTQIINEANKPGLNRWKEEQVLHAALTLPRIDGEPEKDYLARIMRDSQEQAKKAAERGTAIHAAIQGFYEKSEKQDGAWTDYVKAVSVAVGKWASAHPDNASWDAERSFASPLGFGGKLDLSADGIVIDFKTTEKPLDDLTTYDSHWMQLAAYREGLKIPNARCAIVYVSAVEPAARLIEIPEDKLQRGWAMFKALLDYYYARTGMKR